MMGTVVVATPQIYTISVDDKQILASDGSAVQVVTEGISGQNGVGVPSGGTTGQFLKKNSNTSFDTVWDNVVAGVTSVFGRSGAVTAQAGDYTAAQIGGLTSQSVAYANGSGNLTQDNANLKYNDSTKVLTAKNVTVGTGSGNPVITFDGAATDGILTWTDSNKRLSLTSSSTAVSFALGAISSIVDGFLSIFSLFGNNSFAGMSGDLGGFIIESKSTSSGFGGFLMQGLNTASNPVANTNIATNWYFGLRQSGLHLPAALSVTTNENWDATHGGVRYMMGVCSKGDIVSNTRWTLEATGDDPSVTMLSTNNLTQTYEGTHGRYTVMSDYDVGYGKQTQMFVGDVSPALKALGTAISGGASFFGFSGFTSIAFMEGKVGGDYALGDGASGLMAVGQNTGSATVNNSPCGSYVFFAYDGTAVQGGAEMTGVSDGNWSTTSWPMRIVFKTTPPGSIVAVERMVIGSTGQVSVSTLGKGLSVKEGSNAKQGTATLSSGSVVVSNTSVTANSRIFLTAQDNSSTGSLRVSARTAGTSFTVTSSNGSDSGVVAYEIFEPA